ncbi:hypothetical protein NLI96_g8856 [Meripilus lineatus]|uniref:Retrotransposon gag domain-containing protein n=1 Tax=Meripilus lineatus TaxID=2056292 RepID=A0AAD5YFW7_9APHY|nr:hypothetical protein NLI96_g8856 [Physisporinus lineatus]
MAKQTRNSKTNQRKNRNRRIQQPIDPSGPCAIEENDLDDNEGTLPNQDALDISQGLNLPGAMPTSSNDVANPDLVTAQWTTGHTMNSHQEPRRNSVNNREGTIGNRNHGLPVSDRNESPRGTPQWNVEELNPGSDNVRMYLRSVNRSLAKVSERVSRMRREQMAMVDQLNETDDILDELMHGITRDRLRIEQGKEVEELKLTSEWSKGTTLSENEQNPEITHYQSAMAEPVFEAAISSLKSKQGERESREDYERRLGAINRLGLNVGEPGSISQRTPMRETRFSQPANSQRKHWEYRENEADNGNRHGRRIESNNDRGSAGRGYNNNRGYRDTGDHRQTPQNNMSRRGSEPPNGPPAGGAGGPPDGPPGGGRSNNSEDGDASEDRGTRREMSEPVSRRMRSMTPYMGGNIERNSPRFRRDNPINNRLYSRDEYGRIIDNSFAWIRDTIQQNLAVDMEEIPRSMKPPKPDKYDGSDDLEEFDKWLLALIRWMALSHLGGPGKERARLLTLGQFLSKVALEWYNTEVESPHRARRNWTLEEVICEMFDHFVHRTSGKVANQKFREVKYSTKNGVSHLFNEMRKWARRMIEVPTEYDQRVIFMGALPEETQDTMRAARGINEERNTLDDIYYCALDIEEARLHNKTPREPGPSNRPPQTTTLRYRTDQPYTNREGNRYIPREAYIWRNDQYKPTNRPVVFQKLGQPFAQARDGARHRSDERQPSSTKATQGSRPSASGAETKDRERPRDNDKAKMQCYTCKGYGHYANDATCPLRIKPVIRRFGEAVIIEEEEEQIVEQTDTETEISVQEKDEYETYQEVYWETENVEYELDVSQYDSEESLYIVTNSYEPYESDSEGELPVFLRAMRIAAENEEGSRKGEPSNQAPAASEQGSITEKMTSGEVERDTVLNGDITGEGNRPVVKELCNGSDESEDMETGTVIQEYPHVSSGGGRSPVVNLPIFHPLKEVETEVTGLPELTSSRARKWMVVLPQVIDQELSGIVNEWIDDEATELAPKRILSMADRTPIGYKREGLLQTVLEILSKKKGIERTRDLPDKRTQLSTSTLAPRELMGEPITSMEIDPDEKERTRRWMSLYELPQSQDEKVTMLEYE